MSDAIPCLVYERVIACARCAGNHGRMKFKPFKLSPTLSEEEGDDEQHYWAICPKTGEPMFLKGGDDPTLGETI